MKKFSEIFSSDGRMTAAQWRLNFTCLVFLFCLGILPAILGQDSALPADGALGAQILMLETAVIVGTMMLASAATVRRLRDAGSPRPVREFLIALAVPLLGWFFLLRKAAFAASRPHQGQVAEWPLPPVANRNGRPEQADPGLDLRRAIAGRPVPEEKAERDAAIRTQTIALRRLYDLAEVARQRDATHARPASGADLPPVARKPSGAVIDLAGRTATPGR